MNQHFEDFKGEFLTPSENNFADALMRSELLHAHTQTHKNEWVPRMPLSERFNYSEQRGESPQKGRRSSEVLADVASAFQGSIRWNQPNAVVNITPTPLLDSVAAAHMATLYNPNALWDYPSGRITLFEKQVVAFLSHLADWDEHMSDGLSTPGGKATLMYAIKCGINQCDREAISRGVHKGKYVVIASKFSHYSLEDVCDFLGLGRKAVLRVDVDATGAMDMYAFERTFRGALAQGKKIAAVIALGGDTIEYAVDPIADIRATQDALIAEYKLSYQPWLHMDCVNGWIGLTFRNYDFSANPMGVAEEPLYKIRTFTQKIRAVSYADSLGADFHKTGLAPYVSSFFVAKTGDRLRSIHQDTIETVSPELKFGDIHTHHTSLENSRSAQGILSAWTSMHRLGVEGYQRYWAQLQAVSNYLRSLIATDYSDDIAVLNTTALGHAIVVQLLPTKLPRTYDSLLHDKSAREVYGRYCFELYDFMAFQLLNNEQSYPLLGFVPSYRYEQTSIQRPAFLIYCNHPHMTEADCTRLLRQIVDLKRRFEATVGSSKTAQTYKHLPK